MTATQVVLAALAFTIMVVGVAGVVLPVIPDVWLIWLAALAYGALAGFSGWVGGRPSPRSSHPRRKDPLQTEKTCGRCFAPATGLFRTTILWLEIDLPHTHPLQSLVGPMLHQDRLIAQRLKQRWDGRGVADEG